MLSYRQQGAFVCGVFGLVALGAAVYAVRKGSVSLPLRGIDIWFDRRTKPVRYWLTVSIYIIGAIVLLGGAWADSG
jgi:hypothetical protein